MRSHLFRKLTAREQEVALKLVTAVIHADGQITHHEHDLQRELQRLFTVAMASAVAVPARAHACRRRTDRRRGR